MTLREFGSLVVTGILAAQETEINAVTSMRADGTIYHHRPRSIFEPLVEELPVIPVVCEEITDPDDFADCVANDGKPYHHYSHLQ